MASFIARQKSVSSVQIYPFPLRPIECKIARVDTTIVGVAKSGRVFCNRFNKRVCYGLGKWNGVSDILYALVALGRLPQSEVDAYCKEVDERDSADQALYDAESIAEKAFDQRIKLPFSTQQTLVNKVRAHYRPDKVNEYLEKLKIYGIAPGLLTPVAELKR